MLLKAVSKTAGKKDKIFTLRRIDTGKVTSCDDLKKLIKRQLRDDIVDWEEFDVGYTDSSKRGDKVISIRSIEDLTEVWREIKAHADMIQLWCDGLKLKQTESTSPEMAEASHTSCQSGFLGYCCCFHSQVCCSQYLFWY